jgi:hypothetical protein
MIEDEDASSRKQGQQESEITTMEQQMQSASAEELSASGSDMLGRVLRKHWLPDTGNAGVLAERYRGVFGVGHDNALPNEEVKEISRGSSESKIEEESNKPKLTREAPERYSDDVFECENEAPSTEVWLELKRGEGQGKKTPTTLVIHPEAAAILQAVPETLNLVSIFGNLRTGKSYLMNALSGVQAFGVSSQPKSFTKGVHLSSQILELEDFAGAPVKNIRADTPRLAFTDSEGQKDRPLSYDVKLATPLLLTSKVIILNIVCPTGPSKVEILDLLQIMMMAAQQVSGRKDRKKLFGNLHVVLRDCEQDEDECHEIIFENEDEEDAETDEDEVAIKQRNEIRRVVKVAFESEPRLWCLPKISQKTAPADYTDTSPECE